MKVRSAIKFAIALIIIFAFTAVVVVGVPIGVYNFEPTKTISLGLDLTGGVYAVYEADDTGIEDFDSKLEGTMTVLRNRLDALNFTEATITKQGDNRIRVEVPINDESGLDDPQEISNYIGKAAHLTIVDPDGNIIIEGDEMKSAKPMVDSDNTYFISFELNSEGASKFADATTKYKGQVLEIKVDDITISAPTVEEPITGGAGRITGQFTQEEVVSLAAQIESGALPLDLEQIEVRSVTATLGDTALETSIIAGLVGLLILFLFMIAIYRTCGVVADIALVCYISIVLFLISLFKVQLTLPGIAGIILGIGMAVDANVIIFERMKEEYYSGKSLRLSLKNGFKKAFGAIFDANVTTIIAAIVLAFFGTGSIKGFAYTLAISIVVSMFSAIVVTKGLISLLLKMAPNGTNMFIKPAKAANRDSKKEFKVFANFKKWVIVPIAIIIAAVGIGGFSGGLNVGIDFTGGSIITATVGEHTTEDIKEIIGGIDGIGDFQVTRSDNDSIIRVMDQGDDSAQDALTTSIMTAIKEKYPDAQLSGIDTVGATASTELLKNAFLSVLLACALMLIYIWIRFELFSGISAVIALLHDVLIMIAIVCIFKVQVNSSFIAACLTIVGYSINNTIVIFDRVRENMRMNNGSLSKEAIVDTSVRETLTRTIYTTITTMIMILTLYIMGVDTIQEFALPIVIGLVAGAFSSIFLSASVWMKLDRKSGAKRAKKSKFKSIT